MDAFAYFGAEAAARGNGDRNVRDVLRDDRDELRDVLMTLRNRYGRRRLS